MDSQWFDSGEAHDLISSYTSERVKGRDMSAITRELQGRGYPEEVIRELVIAVDDEVTRILLQEAELSRGKRHIAIGAALITVGVSLTVGITLWMNAANRGYMLFYGAILSGGFMVWQGWNVRKRLAEEEAARQRKIFRSRLR